VTFAEQLKAGQAGESVIARWLRGRGCTVLPVYEKILDTGKGPHLFLPNESVVAPDLFVFKGVDAWWMEAKTKTAFTEQRNDGRKWVTGIDHHHYLQYLKVNDMTPWPVWLLFLQMGGEAIGAKRGGSPAGLFGGTLDKLKNKIHHFDPRWGKHGMDYWEYGTLTLLAELDEVYNTAGIHVPIN